MSLSISDMMRPTLRDVLAVVPSVCGRCGRIHAPEIIGYGNLAGVVYVSCGRARYALRVNGKAIVRVCPKSGTEGETNASGI